MTTTLKTRPEECAGVRYRLEVRLTPAEPAAHYGNPRKVQPMNAAATLLPAIERQRLQALARGDTATAGPMHAHDY
jgi:hypothetical protein